MSSDQGWRLLRPTLFFFLLLPHNLMFGLSFNTEEVTELQELEILDLCDNNFSQLFSSGRRLLQVSPPGPDPEFGSPPVLDPDFGAPPPLPTEKLSVDPLLSPFPPVIGGESPPAVPPVNSSNLPDQSPPPPFSFLPDQAPPPQFSFLPNDGKNKKSHKLYIIVGVLVGLFVVMIALVAFFLLRNQKAKMIIPLMTTRSSGQLQDVVTTTGVPKLNLSELETACEDFSNIIGITSSNATIYKGTLSNGSEIAVLAVSSGSLQDWSEDHETQFQEKMQRLSEVDHKNLLNLTGYCHEDEPFNRMLVFEYAPNGTLFEHLHEQDAGHLDWPKRLRITMGIAYCIEHIHNLKPKPISLTNLNSSSVYLATDYAAKVSDFTFLLSSTPLDPMTNVFNFGTLLYEIITGTIPDPDSLLQDEIKPMVDPTLKSFQEEVMEKLWEVVRECLNQKIQMKDVVVKLREITGITAEAALPSSEWWAELEIISTEV